MHGKVLFFSVMIIFSFFTCLFFPSSSSAAISDSEFIEICRTGSLDEINEALMTGVNVDARSSNRDDTAIMVAAANNPNPKVISALIQAGAIISRRNSFEETPLIHAARYNMNNQAVKEIIKILVNAGEDVNVKDGSGRTPVFCAAEVGSPEAVLALLDLGADAKILDTYGRRALDVAEIRKEFRNTDALRKLREASQ